MKLSEAVKTVIDLGRKIREYYDRELPKYYKNYPLVGPNEENFRGVKRLFGTSSSIYSAMATTCSVRLHNCRSEFQAMSSKWRRFEVLFRAGSMTAGSVLFDAR